MRKLVHIGVPTQIQREGEMYSPEMKLFLTDPEKSANKIEFLRFEADSEMPEILQTHTHIAYEVEDFESEMAGKKVIMDITKMTDEYSIAFVEEEGIAIELIKFN